MITDAELDAAARAVIPSLVAISHRNPHLDPARRGDRTPARARGIRCEGCDELVAKLPLTHNCAHPPYAGGTPPRG